MIFRHCQEIDKDIQIVFFERLNDLQNLSGFDIGELLTDIELQKEHGQHSEIDIQDTEQLANLLSSLLSARIHSCMSGYLKDFIDMSTWHLDACEECQELQPYCKCEEVN